MLFRSLGISTAIHAGRAEALASRFGCVVLRAVERMSKAVASAARLVAPSGWLGLLTTRKDLAGLQTAAGAEFIWSSEIALPGSTDRLLALGQRPIHGLDCWPVTDS